jgi:hypothetical protein
MSSSRSEVDVAGEEKEGDPQNPGNGINDGDYERALEIDPLINPINEVYNLKINAKDRKPNPSH